MPEFKVFKMNTVLMKLKTFKNNFWNKLYDFWLAFERIQFSLEFSIQKLTLFSESFCRFFSVHFFCSVTLYLFSQNYCSVKNCRVGTIPRCNRNAVSMHHLRCIFSFIVKGFCWINFCPSEQFYFLHSYCEFDFSFCTGTIYFFGWLVMEGYEKKSYLLKNRTIQLHLYYFCTYTFNLICGLF